jgi:hypothetical protein
MNEREISQREAYLDWLKFQQLFSVLQKKIEDGILIRFKEFEELQKIAISLKTWQAKLGYKINLSVLDGIINFKDSLEQLQPMIGPWPSSYPECTSFFSKLNSHRTGDYNGLMNEGMKEYGSLYSPPKKKLLSRNNCDIFTSYLGWDSKNSNPTEIIGVWLTEVDLLPNWNLVSIISTGHEWRTRPHVYDVWNYALEDYSGYFRLRTFFWLSIQSLPNPIPFIRIPNLHKMGSTFKYYCWHERGEEVIELDDIAKRNELESHWDDDYGYSYDIQNALSFKCLGPGKLVINETIVFNLRTAEGSNDLKYMTLLFDDHIDLNPRYFNGFKPLRVGIVQTSSPFGN